MSGVAAFLDDEPPFRRARRTGLLALVGFIGLCLLVSVVNGSLSAWPGHASPAALAATGWSSVAGAAGLDAALGAAAWLVWRRIDVASRRKRRALLLWGWLLLAYAVWPALAFGLYRPPVSIAACIAMLALIVATSARFWPVQRGAALLLLPLLASVAYATTRAAGL